MKKDEWWSHECCNYYRQKTGAIEIKSQSTSMVLILQ